MKNSIISNDVNLSETNFDYLASSSSSEEFAVIYFDLESANLAANAKILQIGLCYKEHSYGIYITPTNPISEATTKVGTQFALHLSGSQC